MSLAGDAVEHLPPAPIYHTVYFELDTTTPTPESQKLIEGVYQQVADYPVPEVVVIGHTDTQASTAYNMTLSEARAKLIKDNLIAHGITPEMIRVEARGESDLLIPTADNVDEPRNRRVVINVR